MVHFLKIIMLLGLIQIVAFITYYIHVIKDKFDGLAYIT